ncbi:MAG TPA: MGMT family protein [Thermomicrobiales bacterium]|jgi:methylated-DNA-protein-cysteine methyltransferase-like protein|nr:6-O-methylguanine DNA methyltransferase [Chloroflexota bacterium]HBY47279.1 6-O-methylguanine DNA methyltransferase [Chloroflexota bacterium]HCG30335.1 6-O-methylguanine DNA methyltransferase [Chloroflexota bacterium]HQZ88726.1 MGMT family protein [Thermomicrobiales bacterium]HRA32638.1 MGMT family protein [Thermomicrobiales bacterium]
MRQSNLFDEAAEPERAKPLDADPSFPSRVYRLALLIPPGKVTTYGTIAAVLGDRRGARMVGWAMSNCPPEVSDVAHRVVNRYGELSGGWAWGHPDVMKQLLVDEGVTFVDEYRVNLDKHLWIPPMEEEIEPPDW